MDKKIYSKDEAIEILMISFSLGFIIAFCLGTLWGFF